MEEKRLNLTSIASIKDAPFEILTIYLGSSSKKAPSASELTTQLRSLIHRNLNQDQKKLFKTDLQKIEQYLEDSNNIRNRHGLAFFCAGDNFWQAFDFEFDLPPLLIVANKPYTQPLFREVKEHNRYLVLLTDRTRAKLFTVELGQIQDQKEIKSIDVPQMVKAKKTHWGRYDKIPRHIDEHVLRHLKKVVQEARNFDLKHPASFIIIGSHRELMGKIKGILPYPLNKKLAGTFITEIKAPINVQLLLSKKAALKVIA